MLREHVSAHSCHAAARSWPRERHEVNFSDSRPELWRSPMQRAPIKKRAVVVNGRLLMSITHDEASLLLTKHGHVRKDFPDWDKWAPVCPTTAARFGEARASSHQLQTDPVCTSSPQSISIHARKLGTNSSASLTSLHHQVRDGLVRSGAHRCRIRPQSQSAWPRSSNLVSTGPSKTLVFTNELARHSTQRPWRNAKHPITSTLTR